MSDSPLRVPHLPMPAAPWRPGARPRPAEPVLDADVRTMVRHGADLFDHGAYWEAHAIWEPAWRDASAAHGVRDALQGLIQVAAYHLKAAPHLHAAGRRLKRRALERLDRAIALGTLHLHGLHLVRLRDELNGHRPGDAPLHLHDVGPGDTVATEVP